MNTRIRQSVQALDGYVPGEQPTDPSVVKLNTNENPYPPSPHVMEALAAVSTGQLRRYPDPAADGLRDRIAEIHGCSRDKVFVGNGSDEILALCTRCFVENDGAIGYFEPSYSLYPVLAGIRDVAGRPVALGPDFEWRMPDGYSVPLFFLANPNAPTGMLFPRPDVESFCRSATGVTLIDEAYVDFAERDCMDLALELDNTLVLRTLSKSFSLAGLRLGYAVGGAGLIGALMKVKDSYNVPALTQHLGLAALSDLETMRRNIEKIRSTRSRLSKALVEMGCSVYSSEANFVWVRPAALPAEEVFQRLREQNVLVRHFGGERTREFLRITVGTNEEIDRLLVTLRAIHGDGR